MGKTRKLALRLDFNSSLPAYLQITQRVERLALGGRLQPGDQLPTVRALAAELGLNFNTVARAYRLLHRLTVVSPQRGRGTYVVGKPSVAAMRHSRRQELASLTRQYLERARQLHISDDEIAAMIDKELKRRQEAR